MTMYIKGEAPDIPPLIGKPDRIAAVYSIDVKTFFYVFFIKV